MKDFLVRLLKAYATLSVIGGIGTVAIISIALIWARSERDNGWNSIGIFAMGIVAVLVFNIVLFVIAMVKARAEAEGIWLLPTTVAITIIAVPVILPYILGHRNAQRQDIRILEMNKIINDGQNGQLIWIRGKGYTSINNGAKAYFWNSAKPPYIDITIQARYPGAINCLNYLKENSPSVQAPIQILGDGFFSEYPSEPLGAFSLTKIIKCQVTNP